jgi:hypothetical protein
MPLPDRISPECRPLAGGVGASVPGPGRVVLKAQRAFLEVDPMAQFQQALKKLIEDPKYRDAVAKDPHRLTKDHQKLVASEVLVLMQVWLASGRADAAASLIDMCHCCCCV